MSRTHKTLKAGAAIGMNPYGWGNGGKRKKAHRCANTCRSCKY